jgi:thiol-disulfide isomerase/thioredoxin
MKKLLFIWFVIFALGVSAQTTISGVIETNNAPLLFLSENIGGIYHPIDSVCLSKDGTFSFKGDYFTGYYSIGLSDTNWVQFIIQAPEKNIQFHFSSVQLKSSIQIVKSENNKALYNFIQERRRMKKDEKKVYIARSYEEKGSAQYQKLLGKEDSLKREYSEYLIQNYHQHPYSFLWKTALSDAATKGDFFQYTFFDDPELIRSGVFTHKVTDYLQFQTQYTEDGFIKSIDYILDKASVNQQVYDFVLNYLLELFNEVGPDVILDYLVEEYVMADGCSQLETSDIIATKLHAYQQIKLGNTAPDVSIFTVDGYMSSLRDLCSLSNISVLFFGSSQCHFCQEAIPQLIEYATPYSAQQLNILFVSLDTDINAWKKESAIFPHNWISLSELKGWKSTSTELFQIHKTPSFYILDRKYQIISKPKNIEDLIRELDFFMQKKAHE